MLEVSTITSLTGLHFCSLLTPHPTQPNLTQPPAAPYWLDKPQNLVLAPDENGRMTCIAHGNPKPTIQWLMNGEPIESKSRMLSTAQ